MQVVSLCVTFLKGISVVVSIREKSSGKRLPHAWCARVLWNALPHFGMCNQMMGRIRCMSVILRGDDTVENPSDATPLDTMAPVAPMECGGEVLSNTLEVSVQRVEFDAHDLAARSCETDGLAVVVGQLCDAQAV
mmetsp:Transcript_113190/g.325449  ORF Transcript_113190/g.325449 Transcript_113190/m.325449 type:complete len:135 (-) Transcript_113190:104-508(-)